MFHAEQASSRGVLGGGGGGGGGQTGLLNKGGGGGGGGSNRLPGLVSKQQAVEFPQVQASNIILIYKFHTSIYIIICLHMAQ